MRNKGEKTANPMSARWQSICTERLQFDVDFAQVQQASLTVLSTPTLCPAITQSLTVPY